MKHRSSVSERKQPASRFFLVLLVLIGLLATTPLFAQDEETTPGEDGEQPGELTPVEQPSAAYSRSPFKHRVRFLAGFGRGEIQPAFLTEAGTAWQLNSLIAAGSNPLYQAPFQVEEAGPSAYYSAHLGVDWTFRDRFRFQYEYSLIDERFPNNSPTRVSFFHPSDDQFRWSYFEAARLIKYREERRTWDIEYLHPVWTAGLKAGLFLGRESYKETNDVSFGSFVATRPSTPTYPSTIFWSAAGIVPFEVRQSGMYFGPMLRYQIFEWLGVWYRMTFIDRQGTMNLGGIQPLNAQPEDGNDPYLLGLAPVAYGEPRDEGIRHTLEATITLCCRYGLHLGFIQESLERSYSTYFGYTFSNGGYYSQKTPTVLGIGELSQGHKSERWEIYLKFSAALYF